MCKFKSGLIDEVGNVYLCAWTESHSSIEAFYKLPDLETEPSRIAYAKFELEPPNEDKSRPVSEWSFRVDEKLRPEWFTIWHEARCKEEVEAHVREHYKDGKRHGKFVGYYDDGKPYVTVTYNAGDFHGEYISYHPNAQPYVKATYKHDELQGDYVKYSDNGNIRLRTRLKNGERHGKCFIYLYNGSLESVSTYKDGKLHGPFTVYRPDGTVLSKATYKDGIKVE